MIPFPKNQIHDEDMALDWWEGQFVRGCEAMNVQCNAASLVRELVASLRAIRDASLNTPVSLIDAAARSGYSAGYIGKLVRDGAIPNAGRLNAPKILPRHVPKKAAQNLRTDSMDTILDRKRIALAVATSDRSTSNG